MKLYHGTSYEGFQSILKDGFNPKHTIWNCSDGGATYFHDPTKYLEHGEADTIEAAHDLAISRAMESAQIAAAFFGSTSDKIVVIAYEADEKDIQADNSCPNAELFSMIYDADLSKSTEYYTSEYYPDMRLFVLQGLDGNDYLNGWQLPDMTQRALEILQGQDIFIEELLEFDPVSHSLRKG